MKKKNDIVFHKIIGIVILLTVVALFIGGFNTQYKNNLINDKLKNNLLENNKSINMYNIVYNPNNKIKAYYNLSNTEKIDYNNYLINKNNNDVNTILIMVITLIGGLILFAMDLDYFKRIKKMWLKIKKRKRIW